MDNYNQLIERISRAANVSVDEIERKIDAKRAKLSGLISKDGAAQIVAAEMGIVFDQERLKISELLHGMKRANVVGKITQVFPIRNYNKNGREGRIGSFLLGDDSSNVRVVLWDSHHIDLLEKGTLKEGSVVEISNGSVRNGELHLSAFSDLKKSSEKMTDVKTSRSFVSVPLKDVRSGQSLQTRAVIVQVFDPKFFKKKDSEEQGVLLNVVIDDGTANLKAVMFGDVIKSLGLSQEEMFSLEAFQNKKGNILGEEMVFTGNIRTNTYFNNLEMSVDSISNVSASELIQQLEAVS